MLDQDRSPKSHDEGAQGPDSVEENDSTSQQPAAIDESLFEEVAALIDDGKTYAQAELAFQKTRASLAGRSVGMAIGLVVVAIILLHIAFLALAVGLVMALEPLVSIWGAIAIVFGGLLLVVGLLGYAAVGHGKWLAAMFSSPDEDDEA